MLFFHWYQDQTKKTAIYPKHSALEYLALGLTSESGEVAGKIKKIIRDQKKHITKENVSELKSELGDVLWYLSEMCNYLNVRLEDVATNNIKKLQDRQQRGKLGGNGDKR